MKLTAHKIIFLGLISAATAFITPFVPTDVAQALETKTSEAVFIDIVSVVGDSALKTADVIEALDIILGQGLSRYA